MLDGYTPYKPPVLDDVYIDCTEPDWLQATKLLEAYAVSSSGAPVEEKANKFLEEDAALGRAWRSAERGLPAASSPTTTSPALPPTTPGPRGPRIPGIFCFGRIF